MFIIGNACCFIHCRRPEELHTRGYDLSALTLAAVILRFKLASPKAPLDIDLSALLKVPMTGFCQFPEGNNLVPFDALLLLALFVGE